MTLKFAYKFCLIFLVTIAVNIFGEEPTKRFGCHNLSSVDKITSLGNDELLEKLTQCMRNTNTYNEKNLNIAKKLQNDFEATEKMSWIDRFYKKLLTRGFGFSYAVFAASGIQFVNTEKYVYAPVAITSLLGVNFFSKLTNRHINRMRCREEENKQSIALHIKNFVDTLQKKND